MNSEYRDSFVRRVNAARSLRDRTSGKVRMISHAAFNAFEAEIKAARKSGEINCFDFVNCRAVIGEAVNPMPHA